MSRLASHVVNARTHWFERSVRNSDPSIDRSELPHSADLGIWTTSETSMVEVRAFLAMEGEAWSMRFELGTQFQLEGYENEDESEIADFVRVYGGPFVIGMIREAAQEASKQVDLPGVLLPFHIEESIRGMSDAEILDKA